MVRSVFRVGAILVVDILDECLVIHLKAHRIGVQRAWHETCISASVRTLGDIGRITI